MTDRVQYMRDYRKLHGHEIYLRQLAKPAYRETQQERGNVRRYSDRMTALRYYSQNTLQCVCCGEETVEFLTIDHIHGGGTKQRKKIGGSALFALLRRQNYPHGYQVLCMNCNMAKGIHGCCPHQKAAS